MMTTIPPATASRLRRRRRKASRQRLDDSVRARPAARAESRTAPVPSLLVPDAGVESAIDQVYDEVHGREEDAVHENDRHDHGVVATGHREHKELPHARHS